MTTEDTTLRVWVGCLACYNNGRLVGSWHDATEAGDLTPEDIHGRATSHEELWCFDLENFPSSLRREMSPMEAQSIGDAIESVDEHQRGAFLAYVGHVGGPTSTYDLDDIARDFEDAYCGEWDSFREYADEQAEEMLQSYTAQGQEIPQELLSYFDWAMYARDLEHEYGTEDAEGSGVYVFRSV